MALKNHGQVIMTKTTRGRPSKVDLLPAEIKEQLHALLRDKRYTQESIRDAINQLIDENGLDDDLKLSRTGLNRYASRFEEIGSRIRQSREIAEMWTAKLGNAPVSDVGKILQEVVRTLAFETSMHMTENGEPVTPKALAQMALAIQRVEQAAMTGHKREKEIREEFAKEAAAEAAKVGKSAGLSQERVDEIRRKILGIV